MATGTYQMCSVNRRRAEVRSMGRSPGSQPAGGAEGWPRPSDRKRSPRPSGREASFLHSGLDSSCGSCDFKKTPEAHRSHALDHKDVGEWGCARPHKRKRGAFLQKTSPALRDTGLNAA